MIVVRSTKLHHNTIPMPSCNLAKSQDRKLLHAVFCTFLLWFSGFGLENFNKIRGPMDLKEELGILPGNRSIGAEISHELPAKFLRSA